MTASSGPSETSWPTGISRRRATRRIGRWATRTMRTRPWPNSPAAPHLQRLLHPQRPRRLPRRPPRLRKPRPIQLRTPGPRSGIETTWPRRTANSRLSGPNAPRPPLRPPRVRPRPQAELPNPAEDPQGYHDAMSCATSRRRDAAVPAGPDEASNLSERFAVQQHGNEAFEECRAWLSTKPDIEAWALQQPDPWAPPSRQYTREQLAEEIGEDPNAWRKKSASAFAKKSARRWKPRTSTSRPARQAPQMRSAPPAPPRQPAPRRLGTTAGRFAPAPLSSLTKNKFT
jgi:hypothetical protein